MTALASEGKEERDMASTMLHVTAGATRQLQVKIPFAYGADRHSKSVRCFWIQAARQACDEPEAQSTKTNAGTRFPPSSTLTPWSKSMGCSEDTSAPSIRQHLNDLTDSLRNSMSVARSIRENRSVLSLTRVTALSRIEWQVSRGTGRWSRCRYSRQCAWGAKTKRGNSEVLSAEEEYPDEDIEKMADLIKTTKETLVTIGEERKAMAKEVKVLQDISKKQRIVEAAREDEIKAGRLR